jgi:hypothetical protein
MSDAYQDKINSSKQPKKWLAVKNILTWLQLGIRNRYETKVLCDKLNAKGIKTLTGLSWSSNSLAMQLLFMSRLDEDSSLARGWAYLMKQGQVTAADMLLLQDRVR